MSGHNAASGSAVAYIGLGSNLDHPVEQVQRGVAALAELDNCAVLDCSGLYTSPPMGPQNQPDYVNAVVKFESVFSAHALLRELQAIESCQGRLRTGERWGPRTLDLDLLLFNQDIIETEDLIVPHRGMTERAFVLYPLAEIAPDALVPGKGRVSDLLAGCPKNGLTRIEWNSSEL